MNSQEKLWSGSFGNEYTERQRIVNVNTEMFFRKALSMLGGDNKIASVIEFGANEGHNLVALKKILNCRVDGVEINKSAYERLLGAADGAWNCSLLEFDGPIQQWDLSITKGVLIHIHPDDLPKAYEVLYESSSRYILIAEYFNPTPVTVNYRGEAAALWKRDFASEMLDKYRNLRCLDYGFVWRRDLYEQDDLTWFLLGKDS